MADGETESANRKGEADMKEPKLKARETAKNGQQKKKKKNGPDRPQPAWLFPPDKENPVLNPKILIESEKKILQEDRLAAIRALQYKSVTAPLKSAPPGQLLTLVAAFLASYGFNSAGRLFTLERRAREKLDGWKDEVGTPLEKGIPGLVKIFKDWSKEWHERRDLGMTSSDTDDDAVTKRAKMVKKRQTLKDSQPNRLEDTSSSGTSSDDSGVDTKAVASVSAQSMKAVKAEKPSSGSSSSSTSDSDADDETDTKPRTTTKKSTASNSVNKLKRKVSPSKLEAADARLESNSGSDFDTSDSEAPAFKKKKKTADEKATVKATIHASTAEASKKSTKSKDITKAAPKASTSSESSSDSSSSESDSDEPAAKITISSAAQPLKNLTTNGRQSSTDSSTTLNGSSPQKTAPPQPGAASSSSDATSSSSTSDSKIATTKSKNTASKASKRKRSPSPKPTTPSTNSKVVKRLTTPFSRIPLDTKVDPRLSSNAYVPYDYAEKAHQDLSVTKGKGFTKEKNKKKRGAYRGGMIDVGGGKGIKFD